MSMNISVGDRIRNLQISTVEKIVELLEIDIKEYLPGIEIQTVCMWSGYEFHDIFDMIEDEFNIDLTRDSYNGLGRFGDVIGRIVHILYTQEDLEGYHRNVDNCSTTDGSGDSDSINGYLRKIEDLQKENKGLHKRLFGLEKEVLVLRETIDLMKANAVANHNGTNIF